MSYLQELHEAHKARLARMGGKTHRIPVRDAEPNPGVIQSCDTPASRDDSSGRTGGATPPTGATVEWKPIPESVQRSLIVARKIARVTAAAFGVQLDEILVHDRRAHICFARQVAVFLVRKHTKISWNKIGILFGGYDTSSLRHSRSKVRRMVATDEKTMAIVAGIEREIGAVNA